MRKLFQLSVLLLILVSAVSCKEKKNDDIIITRKPIIMKQHKPKRIGDAKQSKTVSWLGSQYAVTVSTKADTSLPLATDGVTKYYDNSITLHIDRADGTMFFDRTFTKSDFKSCVDNAYYKDGALLGIVFDKADGNSLKFAVSVGNPDKSSDEFVPIELKVGNLGGVSMEKSSDEE